VGKTWTIQVLSHVEKSDLADTSMSLVEKRMFISAVADAAAAAKADLLGVALERTMALPRPTTMASAKAAVTGADEEAATAMTKGVATKIAAVDTAVVDRLAAEKSNMGETDIFLDNLGLFDGHKDELRALTGTNWTIDVLAYIDMDDLDDGTTMSLENKKLFLSKVAEHLGLAAAEEARSVAEAAATKEAARVATAAAAAAEADAFVGGLGLLRHKEELQAVLRALPVKHTFDAALPPNAKPGESVQVATPDGQLDTDAKAFNGDGGIKCCSCVDSIVVSCTHETQARRLFICRF
jgi:hypothetical protein